MPFSFGMNKAKRLLEFTYTKNGKTIGDKFPYQVKSNQDLRFYNIDKPVPAGTIFTVLGKDADYYKVDFKMGNIKHSFNISGSDLEKYYVKVN